MNQHNGDDAPQNYCPLNKIIVVRNEALHKTGISNEERVLGLRL